jgi:hypothetical protein
MVNRDDHRSLVFLVLDLLKLRGQKVQLIVRQGRPCLLAILGFTRDHAGIFQRVAEQPDNADEGCVEREIDARLSHGGAMQRFGLGSDGRRCGAEIANERVQRLLVARCPGYQKGIVVARNSEDRRRIVAERLVELVVVILRLAEIVDHVAQMKEKGGSVLLR